MALKTRNKTFTDSEGNKIEFSTTTLPVDESFEIQAEIFKICAAGGISAIGGIGKKSSDSMLDSDVKMSSMKDLVDLIVNRLSAKEMLIFIKRVLQATSTNSKSLSEKDTFDLVFTGELLMMYEVLFFALEANYKSFFGKNGIGRVYTWILSKIDKLPIPAEMKNQIVKIQVK